MSILWHLKVRNAIQKSATESEESSAHISTYFMWDLVEGIWNKNKKNGKDIKNK
jgi:hypothetical protein